MPAGTELVEIQSCRLRSVHSGISGSLSESNNEVRDAVGVDAEALNRQYARTSYDSNYIEPRLKHTVNSNSEQQITEQEVFRILDTLKKTATGLDKLPAWFLCLGAPVFAKRVASLILCSINHFRKVRCLVSGGAHTYIQLPRLLLQRLRLIIDQSQLHQY